VPPAAPIRSTTRLTLADDAATAGLGAALAEALQACTTDILRRGLVIGLSGELGAGKTALVRAMLRRLGVSGAVKSPTFSRLELYSASRLNFYHFDFYRFRNPTEFEEAGFRELFGAGNVCLTEWPERAGAYLPPPDLEIRLEIEDAGGRIALLGAYSEIAERCLESLKASWHRTRGAGG
jgi:tRNA threonylcarbamoyladenosine biosynthesis protein TsaE